MSISRIRAAMLGLLAMMLVGSAMAATASASAGPFWHHRASGGKGEGAKIEPATPENFKGEGGKQTLNGTFIASEKEKIPIEIVSEKTQVKGTAFNAAHQGQIKLIIGYQNVTLAKPVLSNCTPKVGSNNLVQAKGHLAWKWDGTSTQLHAENQVTAGQVWDIVFTAIEPQEQSPVVEESKYLTNGTFTEITLSGTGCGVLAAKFPVSGSEVAIPSNPKSEVGEGSFSKTLAVRTIAGGEAKGEQGVFLQHIWEGSAFQGLIIGLRFNGSPASLVGQTEVAAEQQEVGVFEK